MFMKCFTSLEMCVNFDEFVKDAVGEICTERGVNHI